MRVWHSSCFSCHCQRRVISRGQSVRREEKIKLYDPATHLMEEIKCESSKVEDRHRIIHIYSLLRLERLENCP